MKSKQMLLHLLILGIIVSVFWGCKKDEADQCDDWKYNAEWQKIVDSDGCSAEQKGEAYLALGGFDYFNFIKYEGQPFTKVLNLTISNWVTKKNYYDAAANAVRSSYQKGSGVEQTIFLLGTFAAAYTYLEGELDNGANGNTEFDGEIAQGEIDDFIGADVVDNSSDDGTDLNPTNEYQIVHGGIYYIDRIDTSTDLWTNDNSDGITKNVNQSVGQKAVLYNEKANWTAVYQIAQLKSVSDPLVGAGNVASVTTFANTLVSYLNDMELASLAIGADPDSAMVQQITEFRNDLDNGGFCTSFDTNPGLRIVNLLISKTSESAQLSYENENIFTQDEMTAFGEDATFDVVAGVETGVKLVFLNPASNGYLPHWRGAHSNVEIAMNNIALFGNTKIVAGDGKVAFSEIVCAAELLSETE